MLFSFGTNAQLFRAYVSGHGNDANPCTLPAPCRLLPAALNAVQDGGDIWMLDSANYNTGTVNVAKSVSILAVPGVMGSLVATGGGDAILVNTSGVEVSLRNLVIVQLGTSANGIEFTQGHSLTVGGSEISNIAGNGIVVTAPGATLVVADTVIRNSGLSAIDVESGSAAIDRVRIMGGNTGVQAGPGGLVSVAESLISGAAIGAQALGSPATRLSLDRTRISGATFAVSAETSLASDVVQVTVSRSVLTQSSLAAVNLNYAASSTLSVIADDNVIAKNFIGFNFENGGTVYTRGNNTLLFNTNDLSGGSLTAQAGL
jgi:hypothetical protein